MHQRHQLDQQRQNRHSNSILYWTYIGMQKGAKFAEDNCLLLSLLSFSSLIALSADHVLQQIQESNFNNHLASCSRQHIKAPFAETREALIMRIPCPGDLKETYLIPGNPTPVTDVLTIENIRQIMVASPSHTVVLSYIGIFATAGATVGALYGIGKKAYSFFSSPPKLDSVSIDRPDNNNKPLLGLNAEEPVTNSS